uniref:Spliceosome associated factor 3, U4/U6 recycling protein n=1 Tax=Gadus morhua TaxID=8049 RepID=A0A8C5FWB1_GADMO
MLIWFRAPTLAILPDDKFVTRQTVVSNMAASSNAKGTQLEDMEEDAGIKEEMDSDEEEGMKVESSEDDEDDLSEDDKENEAEIQRLEEQLSINAFDYNCHLDLIKLLRQEGELSRLRSARQKMSELFPLTEEIWLEWLKDEIRLTEEESNREKIYELFEKAVKDYICPDIWLEYAQYSIGGMGSPAGLEKVRSIFERALTAVGLHMTKGSTVWDAYREFENVMLSTLVAEPPKIAEYQAYIEYELKEGDPARIQIIFERALAENCLVPDMWAKYNNYLDRQLKIKDLVLPAHERAVRNCPWTMGLWKCYLLALERHGAEHDIVRDVFEKALEAGFIQATDYVEIWQVYLDYLRRRVDFCKESSKELEELRAAFSRALDYLKLDVEERFSESGDPSCTIMQIWAKIEAHHCKNIQKARELWDSIMTKGNAKFANMWLEYYNLERAYGDAHHCRKALHRAVQCSSDYPEHVCEVLLTFERVEGSLEDWDAAVQKTDTRLGRLKEQQAKVGAPLTPAQQQTGSGQRGAGDEGAEEDMEMEMGLFGRKTPAARTKGPPGAKKPQQQASTPGSASASSTKAKPDEKPELRNDNNSVFISNLAYTLAEPEQKLKALFECCGPVDQVRPVFSKAGVFKGYGYIQFESKASVPAALKLDRQEVEGRPMFVSPCVDKNTNPDFKVFKYNSAIEKHKVFISGLPFSCTKPQLEELCKSHGTVKDVRLVTYRSGKPKGLAYVEFADEAQASHAVLKLDGTVVDDNQISVSISNPPRKNLKDQGGFGGSMSTSMPRQVYGSRGRGRTQVSLLPRSLQRPSGAVAKAENGTALTDQDQEFKKPAKPLSNSDFAKMLFKK